MNLKLFVMMILSGMFLAFGILSVSGTTNSGTCGENAQWNLDTETGLLSITGSGDLYNYDDGTQAPWYDYRNDIKTVVIQTGITRIGNNNFRNCTMLTDITIPDSVTGVGNLAFLKCSSLTSISIPDSVLSIGYSAFSECSKLTSISIPDNLTSIERGTFAGCSSLTCIPIPDKVTTIGQGAFNLCSSLTSVTIPDTVTSLGDSAFLDCPALTSVVLSKNLTSIEKGMFSSSPLLQDITLPFIGANKLSTSTEEGVLGYIFGTANTPGTTSATVQRYSDSGSATYYIPTSLRTVRLTGASQIPYGAFSGCNNIEEIYVNEGVTKISGYAFSNCELLQKLALPRSVTVFGNYVFTLSHNVAIYGKSGSKANTYATENSIPFVATTAPEGVTLTASARVIDGKVIITAVSNSELYDKVVCVALYSGGNLVDIIKVPAVMSEKTAYIVFKHSSGINRAKVFLWDDLTGMNSLTGAAETVIG